MTAQRLQVEVVSWQWLLIPTSGSAHTGFIKLPLPNNVSDVSCSTRVQERNSQSISTLPLRFSRSPNRKKKVKNCVDLLQKEKILKVKVEFIFIQFTSDIKRQLHSPLPRPLHPRWNPTSVNSLPFFLWKLHFYIIQQGKGGRAAGRRQKEINERKLQYVIPSVRNFLWRYLSAFCLLLLLLHWPLKFP